MENDRIYSVGHIAQLCSISVKQLRYLDVKEIIIPAVRDENNKYRYYTEKQIEEILLVREMKQLGIPLQRIAYLLHNRNVETLRQELNQRLVKAREEVERAMANYDKTLEMVMRFIASKDLLSAAEAKTQKNEPTADNEFHLVEVKSRGVVATRYQGLYSANKTFIARRAELYGIIEKYGLETSGPNMAIFHDGYMNQFHDTLGECRIDLEVCMVLKRMDPHCPHCYTQKGFCAVAGVHIGHYRHLQPLYQAMEKWAKEQDLHLSGDSLEEYVIGATHTSDEAAYLTRVFMPLAGFSLG